MRPFASGETGVGKEVLAETLHRLSGRSGELVRVNCAALAPALIESELFWHEKGAFTGAAPARPGLLQAAERGTVFLDEIGELAPAVQAKLLRAIELGPHSAAPRAARSNSAARAPLPRSGEEPRAPASRRSSRPTRSTGCAPTTGPATCGSSRRAGPK